MRPNSVKTKLAAGELVFGTMIFEFLSPGLPRILANAGADFVFYDLEHSGFTVEDMKTQFALCAGAGVIPFARPPGKDYQFTARLLDVGAFGLLYQMVESADEARELVRWTRYPPGGIRGAIFGGAHDDYSGGDMAEKAVAAMERTFTTVLIETRAGLENIDEILAVDGIDAAHLGHADMSLSLGIPASSIIPICNAPSIPLSKQPPGTGRSLRPWRRRRNGAMTSSIAAIGCYRTAMISA